MQRFSISTLRTLSILAAFIVASTATASDYRRAHPEKHAAVMNLIADHTTKSDLDAFAGARPVRCIDSSFGQHTCQWELNKTHRGWKALANALDTSRTVALVCELPKDDTARARSACFAVPRESNRTYLRAAKRRAGKQVRPQRETREVVEQFRAEALVLLDEAKTFFQLVRLAGAVPDQCAPHSDTEHRCVWRTNARTYGHGTIAVTVTGNMSKKVRLDCVLPRDGGPRADGSCTTRVGS